jgi:hypothetical protein
VLLSLVGSAPALTATRPVSVLQPVDTSGPRAAFQELRDNLEQAFRQWRLHQGSTAPTQAARRAVRTLDLGSIGDALAEEVGLAAALFLYETTSRIDLPPVAGIPDAAMVEAEGVTRWMVPGTEITIALANSYSRATPWRAHASSTSRLSTSRCAGASPMWPRRGAPRPALTCPRAWRRVSGICPDGRSVRSWISRSGNGSRPCFPSP